YGAALYRLRPEDFGELRHVDGLSPAWPISYDELEPYYSLAEQLYEVHGNHGEDPTEGHASLQYPFPPVSHEPRIQQLSGALDTDGSGRSVTEVLVSRDGLMESYTAGIVVLACGAANTAKLLLRSWNERHPGGLANGSDQVGRNYMFHNSQAVLALSREENPT